MSQPVAASKTVHRPASYYRQLVPAPPRAYINSGLTPARHATMMNVFGAPGRKTQDCSTPSNQKLLRHIKEKKITPAMSLTGFEPFLDLIKDAMDEVADIYPELYPLVTSAGCLCCRLVRGSNTYFSNHSWGTAVDLKIGGILAPLNATKIPQGLLNLYPFFHKRKIFWAQGYNGRTDPMHEEASNELIKEWDLSGIV
jgi:hypothetical protein